MGADWSLLADIPISEYPPFFRQAYIDWLGAAKVLGPDHGVTQALAKASMTMDKVALWKARLAVKTLRADQREAIAQAAED